jgi:hypothetical protein
MVYLTLLTPAMALAGALLVEQLERWALVPPAAPGEPEEDRVNDAP